MDMVDRIKSLVEAKGMSITAFEKKLGWGSSTITRFRKSSPSIEKVQAIADALDVSIDKIVRGESSAGGANMRYIVDDREMELLSRYRMLDFGGKGKVDALVSSEYERVRLEGDSEAAAN